MPVIAYLRVSTEKQHIENQKEEIRRFAETRGLTIDRWVTETVSGKTQNKDRKLGPLLRKMNSGDTLIVTEISRLSRTLTEIMSIMGHCLEKISFFTAPKTDTHSTTASTAKCSHSLSDW